MESLEGVRQFALSLPGSEEKPCYGTPAFYVRGKLFARLREDGSSLAISSTALDRDALCHLASDVFSVPAHYQNSTMLVLQLPRIDPSELQQLLIKAWTLRAPPTLRARFDGPQPHSNIPALKGPA